MGQGIKSKEARRVVSKRLRDFYRHLEETLIADSDSYFESLMERARAEQEKRFRPSSLRVR